MAIRNGFYDKISGNSFRIIFPLIFSRYLVVTAIAFLIFYVIKKSHLGYELYPTGFSKSRSGRWINTSVNHNFHHQFFKGNYGLYFLWWDRWMGTLRPDYDQRFDEIKAQKAADGKW